MLQTHDVLAPPNRLSVLRAERRDRDRGGWTQTLVARRANISANRYWRIENRENAPTDAEKAALAEIFGVPARRIFPRVMKSARAPIAPAALAAAGGR